MKLRKVLNESSAGKDKAIKDIRELVFSSIDSLRSIAKVIQDARGYYPRKN